MSEDRDCVVLTLPRGERGELRISRATYQGSDVFTKFQFWYPADETPGAELRRGQTLTVRDHELAQLIGVLIRIDKRQLADKLGEPAPAPTTTRPATPAATPAPIGRHVTVQASDPIVRGSHPERIDDEELF